MGNSTDQVRLQGLKFLVGPFPMTIVAKDARVAKVRSRGPGVYVLIANVPVYEGTITFCSNVGKKGAIPAPLNSSARPMPNVFMWSIAPQNNLAGVDVQVSKIPAEVPISWSLYFITRGEPVRPFWPGQKVSSPARIDDVMTTIAEVIKCIDCNARAVQFLARYASEAYKAGNWVRAFPYFQQLSTWHEIMSDEKYAATTRQYLQWCERMYEESTPNSTNGLMRPQSTSMSDGGLQSEGYGQNADPANSLPSHLLPPSPQPYVMRQDYSRPSSRSHSPSPSPSPRYRINEHELGSYEYQANDDLSGSFNALNIGSTEEPPMVAAFFTQLLERFSGPLQQTRYSKHIRTPPVKVAILDTGMDGRHNVFSSNQSRIMAFKDFVDHNPQPEWPQPSQRLSFIGRKAARTHDAHQYFVDSHGHGTGVASVFLRTDPLAQLYVARVAHNTDDLTTRNVAEAFKHARDRWEVDIVILCLGFPSVPLDDPLREVLDLRNTTEILPFVAASNGGYHKTQFPANMRETFCITSTNADGQNWAHCTPSDGKLYSDYTAHGESIVVADLCGPDGGGVRKVKPVEGNSFAAPIVAGVASLVLEFSRQYAALFPDFIDQQHPIRQLKRRDSMRKVLNDMQKDRIGQSIHPFSVFELTADLTNLDASYHQAAYNIRRLLLN